MTSHLAQGLQRPRSIIPGLLQASIRGFPVSNPCYGARRARQYTAASEQETPQGRYWAKIPRWKDSSVDTFLSHKWQMSNSVHTLPGLSDLMRSVLPEMIPPQRPPLRGQNEYPGVSTPDDFIRSFEVAAQMAPMAFRLSPHILSVIDWTDPLNDPVRRQFIPLESVINVAHPAATFDPVQEVDHSPVRGVIHRYPNKALFMATSICPVYCRFCFRSYSVGTETKSVKKMRFLPLMKQWEPRFEYIERTPSLHDIVISGGDTYLLEPEQIAYLGDRLLKIPHIKRFRIATKGLWVSPSRLIDPNDSWIDTVIGLSKKGRKMGKDVCVHTHINNKQETSWITRQGTQRLYEEGVTVRNQSVLLNGVNNTFDQMSELVHTLSDMHVEPGDVIRGAEDLRTPLSDSHELEHQIRDQTAGFLIPRFVYDVPGPAGKRPTLSAQNYDRKLGVADFTAPRLRGHDVKYWDPLWSLAEDAQKEVQSYFADRSSDQASYQMASAG
ncbi:MAG: hypothetical protein L6R42_004572 [Xanthoria sp. 1 TBL-2021]|nr:MAG: hypothetical protein L6R42_004572 [Xanthoria sp. 1 TBL-2021]